MRWNHLTDDTLAVTSTAPGQLTLPGAVVRTFDTPGFAGMTFYEVRAKSLINKVAGDRSSLPFEYTLNPYRGCTHACTYCLQGDTPVLLADGRTKPIAELEVGEAIVGTVQEHNHRRFVTTTVLAKWSTTKPAYRVTLADGTELISSGDHRFLTGQGWKHVTGSPDAGLRPQLALSDELVGTGRFAVAPKDSPEYRRGYLCATIRDDANRDVYRDAYGAVPRFRITLTDRAGVDRISRYLTELGVYTAELVHQGIGRGMQPPAISTHARRDIEAIVGLIRCPDSPDTEWAKGFLAGIFDATGEHSPGALRIANLEPEIAKVALTALQELGFVVTVDDPMLHHGMWNLRLVGGLSERLRFFHTVDPAITYKRMVQGLAINSQAQLNVVSIEPLDMVLPLWDITTRTGDFIANGVVSHNCFARNTHTYLDLDAGIDFDSKIVVKVNAVEVLRRELVTARWQGRPIAMGTNVDCYQRAEGRYRLMPGIIEALSEVANPFSILTKGTLILRDLPLLEAAAQRTRVSVAFSIGFLDESLWRTVESGAPSPARRLDAVRQVSEAGLRIGVLMAPILPGLTDSHEQLDATVGALTEAGAVSVTPLVLHLRPGARQWYLSWLGEHHPELLPLYERLYRDRAYPSADYQRLITARVRRSCREHGLTTRDEPAGTESLRAEPAQTGPPRAGPVQAHPAVNKRAQPASAPSSTDVGTQLTLL